MIISAFLYLHFHLRPLTMEMSLFHDAIVWAKPRTANQLHFLTCIILTWKSFEFTIFHPICFDNQTKLLKVPNCWSWKAELLLFLFVATSPFVETRGGNNWKWGSISLSVVTAFNLHNADQREERERGAKSFKYLQLQFLRSSCFDKCDFSRERGESSPSGRFSTVKGAVPTRPALK